MTSLTSALESYLGTEVSPWGEAAQWTLVLKSILGLPGTWWLLGTLLMWAILCFLSYPALRRLRVWPRLLIPSLRLLAMLLLVLMICQVAVQISHSSPPTIAVVVDTSASSAMVDEYPARIREELAKLLPRTSVVRRIDLAQAVLTGSPVQLLKALREEFRVDLFSVSDRLQVFPLSTVDSANPPGRELEPRFVASGKTTNLKNGLLELLEYYSGSPPVAVVLFTDGNSTAGPGTQLSEGARQLARRDIPLLAVGLGSVQATKDLALGEIVTDAVGFVGDRHLLQITIRADRIPAGKTLVVLTHPGNATVLDSRELPLREGERSYTVELSHAPERAGPIEYEVTVNPVVGETNIQNNRGLTRIWSRESKLRVLLVDRIPRWEFRHVKAVLERDRTTELHTWLQEADAQYSREDRTAVAQLPESADELSRYDAIIWGDVDPRNVPAPLIAALPEFVSGLGGGLLLLPGSTFTRDLEVTRMGGLLPKSLAFSHTGTSSVTFGRIGTAIERTPEGRVHPLLRLDEPGQSIVWNQLPTIFACTPLDKVPDSMQVLLKTRPLEPGQPSYPLLVLFRQGLGLVAVQLFDETWRWKSIEHGAPFRRYWSQMVRLLSKRKSTGEYPETVLKTDRLAYLPGESVGLTLDGAYNLEYPGDVRLAVSTPSGRVVETDLQPSLDGRETYTGRFDPTEVGPHSAKLLTPSLTSGQPVTSWTVVDVDPERTYQPLNESELQLSAELTAGEIFTPWNAYRIPERIPHVRPRQIDQQARIPLWNRWETVLLLVGVLVSEWGLRKHYRLI